ncbi:MAG: hypothetical protein EAZ89_17835 [Bacteroidetes bacterium]|nr:MAG: hypothetical protein EAZ89_17835 [Bacteroidota bacterium]
MKNAIGGSLLAFGLLIMIIGFNKSSGATITNKIDGKEYVYNNTSSYNLNWRAFFGGVCIFFGAGLLIFPSQRVIDAGKYD